MNEIAIKYLKAVIASPVVCQELKTRAVAELAMIEFELALTEYANA